LDDYQKQQELYLRVKKVAVDTIIKQKGTLTHHHSIGYEHIPWMRKQLKSPHALALLRSIKKIVLILKIFVILENYYLNQMKVVKKNVK